MKLLQKAQSYFLKKPLPFGKQSVPVNYTSICGNTYNPRYLPPPLVKPLGSQVTGVWMQSRRGQRGSDISAPLGPSSLQKYNYSISGHFKTILGLPNSNQALLSCCVLQIAYKQ